MYLGHGRDFDPRLWSSLSLTNNDIYIVLCDFSLPGKYNVLNCCFLPFQFVFIACFNLVLEIAFWN